MFICIIDCDGNILFYKNMSAHQGLDSRIIFADNNVGRSIGDIKAKSRLGGYPNYYYRDAA